MEILFKSKFIRASFVITLTGGNRNEWAPPTGVHCMKRAEVNRCHGDLFRDYLDKSR